MSICRRAIAAPPAGGKEMCIRDSLTAARTRTLSLTRKVWHTPCVAWTVRDEKKEPLALARFDAVMVKTAQKMYHELSPETGEFIDFMICLLYTSRCV